MILANLTLSLLSGSGAFFLLINPGYSFSNAAYAFGILSVWQFYCECHTWHKKQNGDENSDNPIVFRFGRFSWRVSEACRHWLISGETGSGKTFFFRRVIWQLCSNVPNWGGLVLDEKGVFIEILRGIFKNHPNKDENDLIVIEVRSDNKPKDWKPPVTFNFLEIPGIPYSAHAKTIVDVTSSLSVKGGGNPYFPQQAAIHMEWGFRCLKAIDEPVTLKNCYDLLTSDELLRKVIELLASSDNEEANEIRNHFENNFLSLNEETFKGVQSTIAGYLAYFAQPEMAEVFSPEEKSTFAFSDLDQGKVLSLLIPQKFSVERKYAYTLIKLYAYLYGLSRFDQSTDQRKDHNMWAIIIDEYQKVATASEAGLSDYNTVDTLREAKIMFMAGTQSIESLTPPMGGQDKAKVFIANMANRVTFKAADEGSAKAAADTIGKHEVWRKSYGVSGGKRSSNRQKEDRYIIQPYKFRQLKKFQCIIQHCERGWQKLTLPPLSLDGKICDWWKGAKR